MAETDANYPLELSVTRHIAAAPGRVWEIMTERMTEWWCPKPWTVEIVELDWRAGGRSAMVMHGPEGEEVMHQGVFLEVTPGTRFVITDALKSDWTPQEPFIIGIWEIAPEGDGTRYTALARHWTKDAMKRHEEMGFTEGCSICAAQLAALAEAG